MPRPLLLAIDFPVLPSRGHGHGDVKSKLRYSVEIKGVNFTLMCKISHSEQMVSSKTKGKNLLYILPRSRAPICAILPFLPARRLRFLGRLIRPPS